MATVVCNKETKVIRTRFVVAVGIGESHAELRRVLLQVPIMATIETCETNTADGTLRITFVVDDPEQSTGERIPPTGGSGTAPPKSERK